MQSNTDSSDTDAVESEYRTEGREEVLPNFVSRADESRAERDEQDSTQCAGDGNVSVVRDGGEYRIIRSNGEQAEGEAIEIERESASRHAVVQGERLWRIPDNWTRYLRVQQDDAPDELLYRIPEPAVYVVVRTPGDDTGDTRYQVEQVGMIKTAFNEQPNRDALRDLISTVEEHDDEAEDVITALRTIEEQWHTFERDYTSYMNKSGTEAVWGLFKSPIHEVVGSWSFDPWNTEQDITGCIPSRDIDHDVLGHVADRLIHAGVVSSTPTFTVHVEDGDQLPPGYFVQALTEAGCSPAEIIDWVMTKTRGHTQATWSDVRDECESQIAENINAADTTLTS